MLGLWEFRFFSLQGLGLVLGSGFRRESWAGAALWFFVVNTHSNCRDPHATLHLGTGIKQRVVAVGVKDTERFVAVQCVETVYMNLWQDQHLLQ